MADVVDEVIRSMYLGWMKAEEGDRDTARRCYSYVNDLVSEVNELNHTQTSPDLQLLRHFEGKADGIVKQYPLNENMVISVEMRVQQEETNDAQNMSLTQIKPDELEENLRNFEYTPSEYHKKNLIKSLPHTLVLSTGRCGTVSLYRLFQSTHYLPYHGYFFQPSVSFRHEMMCQHIEGDYRNTTPIDEWVKTRAAEWLGAMSQNRPMIGLNHLDTIFAPAFSKIHPKSKFIYLHRDPIKVFESLYSKNQWGRTQLQPLHYKLNPQFEWCSPGYDIPYLITWDIVFTEVFSRAFGKTLGDRFIEISADKLFDQDKEEIQRLSDFTETEISPNHFMVPFNQKAHKRAVTDEQVNIGLSIFNDFYRKLYAL